jgi:tetratricopeptide (TPR) repeat protein
MVRRAFLLDPFYGTAERPMLGGLQGARTLEHLEWYKQELTRERGSVDSLPPFLLWVHAWYAARAFHYGAAIEDVRSLVRILDAFERAQRRIDLPVRAKDFRYALADLYHLSGNHLMAAQLYRDVIAEDLGNYMAHVQLARIADATHDTALGLRERRAAVNANPEDHTLELDLGLALQRAGQLPAAESAFRQARALNRRDPWVHYRLGVVLDDLGARDEAREALTTFLAVVPPAWGTPIADARGRLGHLQ